MNIILLSGGSGKRLWPLSNDVRSKQFIKLFKNENDAYESMVQRVYRQITTVDPDEDIVKDITYATNSQNPIDFRDLKSNDSIQILLETSAADLVNIFLHI